MRKFVLHEAIAWTNNLTIKKYVIQWGNDVKVVEGVIWAGKLYMGNKTYPKNVVIMEK